MTDLADQADLAIIIVSTNEAQWLRAVPDAPSSPTRATPARRRRRRQRVDRRDARARRVDEFPDARVVDCENHGFAHANNRGAETMHGALRPVPQPRHRDPRRDASTSSSRRSTSAPTSGWSASAGHRRRRALPDDPALPERPARARRGAGLRALAASARSGSASESSTSPLYDREVDCDWTSGSFMLAGARRCERRLPRRALLHLHRGARPLPAHQARRLGASVTCRR